MKEKQSVITFATGNTGKLFSARKLLPKYEIRNAEIEFDEPRSENLNVVAHEKMRQARAQISGPVMVMDTAFYIEALNGFPATYVNFALKTIGIRGILKLLEGVECRNCYFEECLIYFDGQKEHVFSAKLFGRIAPEAYEKDRDVQWSGLWHIFIPEGFDLPLAAFTEEMLRQRQKKGTLYSLSLFLEALEESV